MTDVSARDALRVAVPLLAGRFVAPFVARFIALPRALRRARVRDDAVDVAVASEVVLGVEALLRTFPRGSGTCLTRALARAYALRRAGVPVRFVLGVRADDAGAPSAHAWLELDGAPFLEARPENLRLFQVIWSDDVVHGTRVSP